MTLPSEMASNELSSSPGLLLPVSNNATCSSSPTTTVQQTHLMANMNQKFNTSQTLIESDPRALQLALELSMAGLNTNFNKQLNQVQEESFPLQQLSSAQLNSSEVFDLNVISAAVAAAAAAQQNGNELAANNGILAPIEDRSKKSQNMTECVPVPSSEHVAEIVGRQGCKIKALRAKTNTYIKTPVRNEEPVFVVTGRKEDVAKAKREILSAAEHFSLIRATRKNSLRGVGISSNGNAAASVGGGSADAQNGRVATGPPIFPGQITIYVRVPYRVVGLVVGPKGATIKHIQQETQTYIVTPSREKEPVFEVTGLPENVQTARKQIEAHIALRTGTLQSIEDEAEALKASSSVENNINGFGTMHTINSLSQILNENINQEFLDSLYKNGICSSFEYLEGGKKTGPGSDMQILKDGVKSATACTNGATAQQRTLPNCNFVSNIMLTSLDDSTEIESNMQQKQIDTESLAIQQQQQQQQQKKLQQQKDVFVGVNNSQAVLNNHVIMTTSTHVAATRSCSSASSTTSSKSANNSSGSNSGSGGSTCSSRPELLGFWKNLGDSLESDEVGGSSSLVWQTQATSKGISPTDLLFGARDPIASETTTAQNEGSSGGGGGGGGGGITAKNISAYLLKCVLCNKKDVVGALLPCGHNIFCIECASVHSCPMCNQSVYQQSSRPSLPLP